MLSQGVKFNKTQKSASWVVGYVFDQMKIGGSTMEDNMFCTKMGCRMWIYFIPHLGSATTMHWEMVCCWVWYVCHICVGHLWLCHLVIACKNYIVFFIWYECSSFLQKQISILPKKCFFLISDWQESKEKEVVDPNKLLMEYSMANKSGWSRLHKILKKICYDAPARSCLAAVQKQHESIWSWQSWAMLWSRRTTRVGLHGWSHTRTVPFGKVLA